MKRIFKIMAAIIAFAIIGIVLLFADGLLGNPISKHRVQNTAQKHITENYSNMNYRVEKAQYNFKSGGYYVRVTSAESVDLNFYLSISKSGELIYDSYESDVKSGFNTWERLDLELREIGKGILENELPFEITHSSFSFEKSAFEPGLFTQDMMLDITNPPVPISASITVMDSNVSYKKAAEILNAVSDVVLQKNYPISFYNISIEYKSKDPDSKEPYKSMFIYDIPSDLLHSDDLEVALEQFDSSQHSNEGK